MLIITMLAILLPSATPVSLNYSGPKNRHTTDLSQFNTRPWTAGDKLFVAVPDTNLREAANSQAAVLAVLPLAAPVTVKTVVDTLVRVGERVDRWYEIDTGDKHGFVFGGALTPAGYRFDFDGDGIDELVTVAFTPDYKIRIRDQKTTTNAPVNQLDLEPGGQGYVCCGGALEIATVPKKEASLPLLVIKSTIEACGDYAWYYVSAKDAHPQQALWVSGLADAPSFAEPSVTFDSKGGATVVIKAYSLDDNNKEAEVERHTKRYLVKNGVFVEKTGK